MSLLLAQSGHFSAESRCLLLGVPGNASENTGFFVRLATRPTARPATWPGRPRIAAMNGRHFPPSFFWAVDVEIRSRHFANVLRDYAPVFRIERNVLNREVSTANLRQKAKPSRHPIQARTENHRARQAGPRLSGPTV